MQTLRLASPRLLKRIFRLQRPCTDCNELIGITIVYDDQRHRPYHVTRPCLTSNSPSSLVSPTLPERFVSHLPAGARPYARLLRLDRPIGTWLLLWPCWWSIALATPAGQLPSLLILSQFATGAIVMRGAGCIVNDLWDRNFDGQVERTKTRPLASGELDVFDSLVLLAGTMGIGLLVLLQFDMNSILLGASSLALVVTYPAFKRFTHWPQIILGLTFNWGALLGWSVVHGGQVDWSAVLPLYAAGIAWTMFYDTIYAHQDRADDEKLGLKSTAIRFGSQTSVWLAGFTALMASSLGVAGLMTQQVWPYYLATAAVTANLWNIRNQVDIDKKETCHRGFVRNSQIGWILFAGIVGSTWLKERKKKQSSRDSKVDFVSQ